MNWTNEQKREYGLTPYMAEDGRFVHEHLAFMGYCSGCGEKLMNTLGIDKPAASLIRGYPYNVIEESYDKHPCKAEPYRLKREYNPKYDMAHPITNARFIPETPSPLWETRRYQ